MFPTLELSSITFSAQYTARTIGTARFSRLRDPDQPVWMMLVVQEGLDVQEEFAEL
jgi:hypothetical protein